MKNKRSTKEQSFCWQEKKVLRLFRCLYVGKELDRIRNLYLTLTEIYSDFNGQDIKYYTETIAKYSGLSKGWIPKGLKILEELKVIELVEERSKGKFKGKKLIFTPENVEEMEKFTREEEINNEETIIEETVTGKTITGETIIEESIAGKTITGETIAEEITMGETITGETITGETITGKTITGETVADFLQTSEDIFVLEDNKRLKDINNTHTEGEKNIENRECKKDGMENTPVEIQQILKKYKELNLPDFDYRPENHILLRAYGELGAAKLFEALTLMSQSKFVKNNMSVNAIFKVENLKKAINGNFKDKIYKGKKSISDTKKEFKEIEYEDSTGEFIKGLLAKTSRGGVDEEM
ncbi:hypothetical protein [Fusobacterium varium]|uniref:Uncharacterized protein n=2 Tax=Fusobacterium varium ATCC 27725 TaxID=469618 RepID=A0ABN5JLN3_FUSVA|nr:hypothetical protein [Fusobacterium varium]AVQ32289.1 hypothetical protein C4N18_14050 [Fusobacterium varium ATCC 27725]VEH38783.1 Uncharacterised protein [Fusobacterium varium]